MVVYVTNLTKGCKDGVNVGNYYKENGYIPCSIAKATCPYGVVISNGDYFCKCAYN